jgi:hypothetical protein
MPMCFHVNGALILAGIENLVTLFLAVLAFHRCFDLPAFPGKRHHGTTLPGEPVETPACGVDVAALAPVARSYAD